MANENETYSRDSFAVVGAGIAGATLARRLAQAGRRVVLIDRGRIGCGATGAAAGILEAPLEARSAFQLGLEASFLGYAAFVRELALETGSPIALESLPSLRVAAGGADEKRLRRRAQRPIAAGTARWLERDALAAAVPGIAREFHSGLLNLRSARVHPPALVAALAESLRRLEVEIWEESEAVRLAGTASDDSAAWEITVRSASRERRLAGSVPIVCAGAATTDLLRAAGVVPEAEVVPVRGQMVELDAEAGFSFVLHVDDHYLIPRPGGRLWVGATVEEVGHEHAVTAGGVASLVRSAERALPALRGAPVVRAWCGLRPRALRRGGALAGVHPLAHLAGHYRSGILAAPRDADRLAARLLGVPVASFSPFYSS